MTAARKRLPDVRPSARPRGAAPAVTRGASRLDAELEARLVALCGPMSTSWHRATRSDALRAVILAGLPIVERQYPPK